VLEEICGAEYLSLVAHTVILLAMISAASFAGTSSLFAAWIAGVSISWWDGQSMQAPRRTVPSEGVAVTSPESQVMPPLDSLHTPGARSQSPISCHGSFAATVSPTGIAIFKSYYYPAVHRVLLPFFFVCHSIP
jgi:hypothetical protein